MARPSLFNHRKFLRLARILRDDTKALGSLEFLWNASYESGDEVLGDAADVEGIARWKGKRGDLVRALVECGDGGPGFIEPVPGRPDRFMVHDLWHHAPDYVRKRRKRESERRGQVDPLSDRSVDGQRTDSGRLARGSGPTPAPAPAPAPREYSEPPDRPPVTDSPPAGGSSGKGKSASRKPDTHPMPADYDFTQEFRDLAAAHGIVSPAVDVAWDRHKAHHQTKGSMFTNAGWTGRAWLQWLTNEIGYRSSADIKAEAEAPPPVPRKVTPAAWEAHPGIVEFRKKPAGESGE